MKFKIAWLRLDTGADDYLTKPFALDELSARIRALLRRNGYDIEAEMLTVADLVLRPLEAQMSAVVAGKPPGWLRILIRC